MTPEDFKQRIVTKYPQGASSDGTPYAQMDATDLVKRTVQKYPDGVTNDGIRYDAFLPQEAPAPASRPGYSHPQYNGPANSNSLFESAKNVTNALGFGKTADTIGSLIARNIPSKIAPLSTVRQNIPAPSLKDDASAALNVGSLVVPQTKIATGATGILSRILPKVATKAAPLLGRIVGGVAAGGTYDAGQNLENGRPIAQPGIGTALGVTAPLAGAGLKAILPSAENALSRTTKYVTGDAGSLSKADRLQAFNDGRVKSTLLGGKSFTPSKAEQNAGTILNGKLSSNPVKNVPVIKSEIAKRGQELEQLLGENGRPISNEEHASIFAQKRAEAAKSLTDSELKAYDEQVKMFSKQLLGKGNYNTGTYYKALKDYEANVAEHLPRGQATLIDPTGIANAKIHAASDVRAAVRDMLAAKHPEFKQKVFDLASLYGARDTAITKADKLKGNSITRLLKNPAIDAGLGIAGYEGIKHTVAPFLP